MQISDENVHHVRELLDEVFGPTQFCSLITFRKKTMPLGSDVTESISDYLLWYCKDRKRVKANPLFRDKRGSGDSSWAYVELADGARRRTTAEERSSGSLPHGSRVFQTISLLPAQYRPNQDFQFELDGVRYAPPKNSCWKTTEEGMEKLRAARRLIPSGSTLRQVAFYDDYPVTRITNLWGDTSGADDLQYVVQTNTEVVQRCVLSTTGPGDLVFDPTCGSGTSAHVAEQWGRRWISCDTSRVAVTLAKQRLMTALYDYYELTHPDQGVGSGFRYKMAPHVTLKSIANNPEIREGMSRVEIDAAIAKYAEPETLYDQPFVDKSRARVAGPFTVEAVPAPAVKPVTGGGEVPEADGSEARSGDTLRHADTRICHRYGVSELAIFGSGARGQLREDSDIDLLVAFDDGARIGLVAFARLRQELSELFGRPVDLVPKDGLKPALRKRVLGESRTLYAARPALLVGHRRGCRRNRRPHRRKGRRSPGGRSNRSGGGAAARVDRDRRGRGADLFGDASASSRGPLGRDRGFSECRDP